MFGVRSVVPASVEDQNCDHKISLNELKDGFEWARQYWKTAAYDPTKTYLSEEEFNDVKYYNQRVIESYEPQYIDALYKDNPNRLVIPKELDSALRAYLQCNIPICG